MQINSEISALFSLMDDNDEEVFSIVERRVLGYGRDIVPNLEDLWEASQNSIVQRRVKEIIHQLHLKHLTAELMSWRQSGGLDLIEGCALIGKFFYPEKSFDFVSGAIEKLHKNIWLELNDGLTYLEQVTVISYILFCYEEIKSERNNYKHIDHFFLHHLLEKKRGNAVSTSSLYQHLCEKLYLPVRLIDIPNQYVLACFNRDYEESLIYDNYRDQILFYVDAVTGRIFSQTDLIKYFELYNISVQESFFRPLNHFQIVGRQLKEIGSCFSEKQQAKIGAELEELAVLITQD